ncbi:MAG: hypothetical protein J0H73_04440 [Salana multivorans]|uniref:hypothetical protein n=1 Tax=Salana multivorans TaxID=120377 RepID=UPI001AD2E977|nr:hypothetical protein [Salana multivorans]MBN8881547.1 hypothetical protein [Salana multivorans]
MVQNRRVVLASAAVVAVALTVSGCGSPQPTPAPADAAAELISDVAPSLNSTVGFVDDGGALVARTDATTTVAPWDPASHVTLTSDGTSTPLMLSLPVETRGADETAVADDGTLVYSDVDGRYSAAVQVAADGTTRLLTITQASDGPHEFTYELGEGVRPELAADGTVRLVIDGGTAPEEHIGELGKPWAVDASGRDVATHYEVNGTSVVQVIEPDSETVYPVVADPSVSFGWYIYIRYSRAEQRTIAGLSALVLGSALCTVSAGLACVGGSALAFLIQQYIRDRGGVCPVSYPRLEVRLRYSHLAGIQCVK